MRISRTVRVLVWIPLVIAGLVALSSTLNVEEADTTPYAPVVQRYHLVDFDLYWYNTTNRPVDQISIEIKETGQIFEANITRTPWAEPGKCALYTAPLREEIYKEALKGFKIVNARTK